MPVVVCSAMIATIKRASLLAPRFYVAARYYTPKIGLIARWLFTSREHTNFTYDLTHRSMAYLASMLSVVTGRPADELEQYLHEPLEDAELLDHVREKTLAHPTRFMADERARFGRRLGWYAAIRAVKPRVVVETGVDKGLGAVLLCSALRRNAREGAVVGRYYGTDINPQAGYLLDAPYGAFGEILYGDSIASLRALPHQIDLFINDSDHSAEYELSEYRTIGAKLSPRALVLGDNAHASDSLLRFSRETGRRFLMFREDPDRHWYPGAGIGFSFPCSAESLP